MHLAINVPIHMVPVYLLNHLELIERAISHTWKVPLLLDDIFPAHDDTSIHSGLEDHPEQSKVELYMTSEDATVLFTCMTVENEEEIIYVKWYFNFTLLCSVCDTLLEEWLS